MGHSVFNHIDAVQEANRLADVESFRDAVHYTNWIKPKKKSSKAQEISPYVPVNIYYFTSLVQEVLDPKCTNPRKIIADNKELLDHLSMGGDADESVKQEALSLFNL
jgi:hypothetical protein